MKRPATFADVTEMRDLVARRSRVCAAIRASDDVVVLDALEEELGRLTRDIDAMRAAVEFPVPTHLDSVFRGAVFR